MEKRRARREGKVEDEPDDDDGEEPRGRREGVAYFVVSVLRPALSGGGTASKSKLPQLTRKTDSSDAMGKGWPVSFSGVSV